MSQDHSSNQGASAANFDFDDDTSTLLPIFDFILVNLVNADLIPLLSSIFCSSPDSYCRFPPTLGYFAVPIEESTSYPYKPPRIDPIQYQVRFIQYNSFDL